MEAPEAEVSEVARANEGGSMIFRRGGGVWPSDLRGDEMWALAAAVGALEPEDAEAVDDVRAGRVGPIVAAVKALGRPELCDTTDSVCLTGEASPVAFFLVGGGSGDLPPVVCGDGSADVGLDDAWATVAAASASFRAPTPEIPESSDSVRAIGGFFGGGGLDLIRSKSCEAADSVRAMGDMSTFFFFGGRGAGLDTPAPTVAVTGVVRAGWDGRTLVVVVGGLRRGPRAFRGSGGIGAPLAPPPVVCGLEAWVLVAADSLDSVLAIVGRSRSTLFHGAGPPAPPVVRGLEACARDAAVIALELSEFLEATETEDGLGATGGFGLMLGLGL
ncbi:hypothetical protein BZA05DRAFT_422529 [Tricharina praecox]|uniref:uncharacterized protein n=1 Tax=Tricharina praecox TaxID=43433 RepID=UPI00221F2851|nr:uncharacterized protein BZA05DRAFT_423068 [Tricharina praecox]XP_051334587.1 uncharacterized protein BZA05DRAFT_423003 [Tricharina praecox]XP_051335059.1 uncharacterized protein BZA05DRAFT_422529 [Tricharina praecox]KAI5840614.1 hypothetical protein BZA05DRAFT_423068 [Tricharina praecox]KAI5840934.1 hypothetical protein BZA05DRAFT_423003 [Tricharina praecox]KAI5842287.1 hypothetical protein BZA05DRAFT_422529 [Tricharina praecox]